MIIDSKGSGFSLFIHADIGSSGIEWFVADDAQINDVLRSFQLAQPMAIRLIQVAQSTDQSTFNATDKALHAVLESMPDEKSKLEQKVQTVQDLVKLSQAVLRYIAQNAGVYEIPTMRRG